MHHDIAATGVRAAKCRFTAYREDKLHTIPWFKYRGCVLLHNNNNIPAMYRDCKRVRTTRGGGRGVSKILIRQEVPTPVAGMF